MAMTRRTNKEWRALIGAQEASGQTQEQWCLANGVNLHTLRDRASKLRRLDKQTAAAGTAKDRETSETQSWVEIERPVDERRIQTEPEAAEISGKLTIETGTIRLTADAGYPVSALASLLRELARPC